MFIENKPFPFTMCYTKKKANNMIGKNENCSLTVSGTTVEVPRSPHNNQVCLDFSQ
jgi:hypothetical protein